MTADGTLEVRAASPGVVIQIPIEPGADVQQDDELVIVECMKLEIPVQAPSSGTVREIAVNVGDRIDEDDLLVVLVCEA
jgi:biotin carboxyl carrier protein